jgi:threonine aldolase
MNDYNYTGHPEVIRAVAEAPVSGYIGYGCDEVDDRARDLVRAIAGVPDADVHFLPGGTQTNLTALAAFLRPHEAVIAPATAHISKHEAGAIEATGHKVYAARSEDGKLTAETVQAVVDEHVDEHFVKPRLVYISQSTEYGTVYTRDELSRLRSVCDRSGLLLYVDGARIALAAEVPGSDADIACTAAAADALCIGGTKNGLLFGEALVINNPALKEDMRFLIKQRGGLLAKGFLLGIQFEAALKDGLYGRLARQANERAAELREGLKALGYSFRIDSPTNQIFPIVTDAQAERAARDIIFEVWERVDGGNVEIRFVTTWRTTRGEIDGALNVMKEVRQ